MRTGKSRAKKRAKKRQERTRETRHWKGIHDEGEKPPVEYVVINGRPALRIKCRDRCLRQAELDLQGKGEMCPCDNK